MHLNLDDEIYRLESRIASCKGQLTYVSRATGRRAMHGLASPAMLAAGVAVGFAVGGLGRRRRNGVNGHDQAAGASGIAGLLLSGAMWFVREQYGSPGNFARAMIEKFSRKP